MKKKLIALLIAVLLIGSCVTVLAACSSNELVVWVGAESAAYYTKVLEKWAQDNDCKYKITVRGVDSSSAAGTISNDAQAGPAIFTIPHDNLGKLIGANPILAAFTDQELLDQIRNDNPEEFQNVVKAKVGGKEYTYGAPYIAQALVLFYDKSKITDDQVKSWEGIQQAARAANAKATTVMGNDSYNLSFFQLATNAETHGTSVELYTPGATNEETIKNVKFTGDDNVARFRWAQRFFGDANGGALSGDTGFESLLKDGSVLSLIGGAWKYEGVAAALGDNLGIAELPTFTITTKDEYGTCPAGTVMKSGSFYDAKILCLNAMNKVVQKDKALCEQIIKYMSSVEIQEGSFEEANNLPAYKNAATEFEAMQEDTPQAKLAQTQYAMRQWSISQPFGPSAALNTLFYSSGQDTYTQDILQYKDSNNGGATYYSTGDQVKEGLQKIENILRNVSN